MFKNWLPGVRTPPALLNLSIGNDICSIIRIRAAISTAAELRPRLRDTTKPTLVRERLERFTRRLLTEPESFAFWRFFEPRIAANHPYVLQIASSWLAGRYVAFGVCLLWCSDLDSGGRQRKQ